MRVSVGSPGLGVAAVLAGGHQFAQMVARPPTVLTALSISLHRAPPRPPADGTAPALGGLAHWSCDREGGCGGEHFRPVGSLGAHLPFRPRPRKPERGPGPGPGPGVTLDRGGS